jgi:hypothetical protein
MLATLSLAAHAKAAKGLPQSREDRKDHTVWLCILAALRAIDIAVTAACNCW